MPLPIRKIAARDDEAFPEFKESFYRTVLVLREKLQSNPFYIPIGNKYSFSIPQHT